VTSSLHTELSTALHAVGLPEEAAGRLELPRGGSPSESGLDVHRLGAACVGAALVAGAELFEARGGDPLRPSLDWGLIEAALISERLFEVSGRPSPVGFAPESRFWQAADGWVRTHANYPWHRRALHEAVGAAGEDLARAIAGLPADEVESRAFQAGGVAAAVRSAADWSSHPQGRAVAAEPLVDRIRLGDAEPRRRDFGRPAEGRRLPASEIRVLDFTRVIAGPVCTRFLGALGAEVLRIDPPHLLDFDLGMPADMLLGKRSAHLDLRDPLAFARLDHLLKGADVVVLGYRPGALARFGLQPETLASAFPGLVVLELSAWGHTGPCADRRGFDSIVQAASGIAAVEAGSGGAPGALPCQLLDHGTGYLAAAAALAALTEQRSVGGSHLRRLSLARTARWLLQEPAEVAGRRARPSGQEERCRALVSEVGDNPVVRAVPPPGTFDGRPLRWPAPAVGYGGDDPVWAGEG
jgi:crotonobetainyl-CoA:carnitine CoA-transferase CaiB-like acyl-CoA transferase